MPTVVPTVKVPVPELINVSVASAVPVALGVTIGILTAPESLSTMEKLETVPPAAKVPIVIGPVPPNVRLVTFVVVNVVTVNTPDDVFVSPVYVDVAIVSPPIVTGPDPEVDKLLIFVSVNPFIVAGAVLLFVDAIDSVLPVSINVPITIGPDPPKDNELRFGLVKLVIPEAKVDVLVLFQVKDEAKPFVKLVKMTPPVPELFTAVNPVSLKVVITLA